MLFELRQMGVHDLILEAALILRERGLSRDFNIDPETGEVDVEGALMLALGVDGIVGLIARPAEKVPGTKAASFIAAVDLLDAACPSNYIWEWTSKEEVTAEEVASLLLDVAFDVAFSVVPGEPQ